MRDLAITLLPNTFPYAPHSDDRIVGLLKQRTIYVDGYEVVIYLSREDHDDVYLERLEILGSQFPFLPMYLVCKIAARFLGGHGLKYEESYKSGHKVYIWTVLLDKQGRPMPVRSQSICQFEGFAYSRS